MLLDFWAVWCGPCIATFPHLREWQKKYGDKGLVIVGLTKYHNYRWDEAAKRVALGDSGVSQPEEQHMLARFATANGLKHRLAVQSDSRLYEFYGITGIPHVVIIDQIGKIRLMKTGASEGNSRSTDEMLAELSAVAG